MLKISIALEIVGVLIPPQRVKLGGRQCLGCHGWVSPTSVKDMMGPQDQQEAHTSSSMRSPTAPKPEFACQA